MFLEGIRAWARGDEDHDDADIAAVFLAEVVWMHRKWLRKQLGFEK